MHNLLVTPGSFFSDNDKQHVQTDFSLHYFYVRILFLWILKAPSISRKWKGVII